jgi:tripartite-type tricarboxylate transporter receptor subunit TctC
MENRYSVVRRSWKFHHQLIQAHIMKLPHRRQFLHLAAGAAALPAVPRVARAQTYPTRPIAIVVPYPAGGPSDTVIRIISEKLKALLGQSVVIENVGGAGGSIGVGRVARAAPDGYTLVAGIWNTHVANGALYALTYDVVKDFEPLSLLVTAPNVIVARKTMPANQLSELVDWLKENPARASQGSAGVGGMGHVAGLLVQNLTGTRFQHVPYRGSAPAMQDLVAGQIDIMFDVPSITLPQVRAGAIKAYAVMAKRRLAKASDIPTTDEAGFAGVYASNWFALFAPKSTSKTIIAKLTGAISDALADPVVQARFAELDFEIPPRDQQTPEALAAYQKAEIEKWWPVIKAAGINGE